MLVGIEMRGALDQGQSETSEFVKQSETSHGGEQREIFPTRKIEMGIKIKIYILVGFVWQIE